MINELERLQTGDYRVVEGQTRAKGKETQEEIANEDRGVKRIGKFLTRKCAIDFLRICRRIKMRLG